MKDMIDTAGFPVSEVINHGFIISIYASDPNGIPIEFSCNVKGIGTCVQVDEGIRVAGDLAVEGDEELEPKKILPNVAIADNVT